MELRQMELSEGIRMNQKWFINTDSLLNSSKLLLCYVVCYGKWAGRGDEVEVKEWVGEEEWGDVGQKMGWSVCFSRHKELIDKYN